MYSNLDWITLAIWIVSFVFVVFALFSTIYRARMGKSVDRPSLNYSVILYVLLQIFIVFIYVAGGISDISIELLLYVYLPSLFVIVALRIVADILLGRSKAENRRALTPRYGETVRTEELDQLVWDEKFVRFSFLLSLVVSLLFVLSHFVGIIPWFFSFTGIYVDSAISFTGLLFVFWLIYFASLWSKRKKLN